jgi:hypothetical protein
MERERVSAIGQLQDALRQAEIERDRYRAALEEIAATDGRLAQYSVLLGECQTIARRALE